jgi:hypothetical protein
MEILTGVMLVFSATLVNCCPSRFRTYKIATPHQTKAPEVKTTFRDWCLYSSFVHAVGTSSNNIHCENEVFLSLLQSFLGPTEEKE